MKRLLIAVVFLTSMVARATSPQIVVATGFFNQTADIPPTVIYTVPSGRTQVLRVSVYGDECGMVNNEILPVVSWTTGRGLPANTQTSNVVPFWVAMPTTGSSDCPQQTVPSGAYNFAFIDAKGGTTVSFQTRNFGTGNFPDVNFNVRIRIETM